MVYFYLTRTYIYSEAGKEQKLYQLLHKKRRFRYPRLKRRQRKTASETEKIRISERSREINQREIFGHWEGDILLFTKHNPHLITLRERKSRYLLAIKSMSRQPHHTTHTVMNDMKEKVNLSVQSLTLDNDISFADHKKMAELLNADIYFCEPYKSYQKGGIENGNGLLRRYLPKPVSLDKITQNEIELVVEKFNNQPMKCLGYHTPKEIFFKHMGYVPTLGEICT